MGVYKEGKTKREAQAWEREQLNKASSDLDMTFGSFVERYTEDMKTRLKENTWATKEHIIRTKLVPYFGKLRMNAITAQQIIAHIRCIIQVVEIMSAKSPRQNCLS